MNSFWMLGAAVFFSLMGVFVKLAADYTTTFELVFYRSIFGVASILVFIWVRGLTLRTPHLIAHFRRSFVGTVSLAIWFYALGKLPIGTGMTLNYTSPLFMAILVMAVALKNHQKVEWSLILCIFFGFVGVTEVLQPSISDGQEAPALFGLCSGFLSALAYWNIRILGKLKEPTWRTVFYFTLFGTLFGLGGTVLSSGFSPFRWDNTFYIIGMGVTATLAQLCLTRAFGAGNVLLTSTLQFSTIIFAAILGLVVFDESISTSTMIGIGLIIVSGVFASALNAKALKKAP